MTGAAAICHAVHVAGPADRGARPVVARGGPGACSGIFHFAAPGPVDENARMGCAPSPRRRTMAWISGAMRSGSGGPSTSEAGVGIIHRTDSAADHHRQRHHRPRPRNAEGDQWPGPFPSRRSSRDRRQVATRSMPEPWVFIDR